MILLYSNSMINCCQSLNGLEQIDADVIILDGNNVETELDDLQTQIDNLQTEITNGGGYFQVIGEAQSTASASKNFSFGANTNDSELKAYLPNSIWYGVALSSGGVITSPVDIDIIINSITYTFSIPNGSASTFTDFNLNTAVSQGQTLRAKFGTNLGVGGSNYRITLFFRTSAVNGQNVSFFTPDFTLLNANQNAFLTDTITTSNNTQNHQLHFGIPRGRSVYAYLGSVSSGTAAVSMNSSTNTNGDQEITFNFVLQTGAQGSQGPKGDKGDDGNADPIVLAVAAAAGAAAGGGAGAAAGAAAGSAAGSSAGASSGSSAATAQFNSLVDPRLQDVENKTYNIQTPANVLDEKTTIGGIRVDILPSGQLNLGGAVFGYGTTNTININCDNGMIVDCGSTQFTNAVNMLDNLDVGKDLDVGGAFNVIESITCFSDIALNTFITFNNGSQYDSATFQAVAVAAPSANNQGQLILNSNIFTSYSKKELFNNQQLAEYPYITFKTDAGFSGFDYGTIFCDTLTAPNVNNGGDFTFACNQLTTSNNLVVNGDLQVVGDFILNNFTLDNLTINNTLKTALINPLDDNVVMDIGNATAELNLTAQIITAIAETISIGANDNVNVVELAADSLSIGENVNCGIIDIGNNDTTETSINGLDLGVNTEIINLGQNGTTTQITARADTIVIGDTTTHGKTTSIDTQIIDIGINGSGAYPCEITIGSDTSTTDVYGDVITIGDPNSNNSTQILSDICNILTNGTSVRTNALDMGSNYTTTANLTAQAITLLGTATTTLRGDTINIGNDNSTDTIQIGNSVSYTEIEGSQISMGVGSVLNTINIGNAFSVVNIQGNQNNAINVAGMFFNQIGF